MKKAALILALAIAACSGGDEVFPDGDGDSDGDSDMAVDILFMIDNSSSMEEEQARLNTAVRQLLGELINPTPIAGSGDTPPAVTDLHVGVVTSDMRTGDWEIPIQTCTEPDDGILRSEGQLTGCLASYSADECATGQCPWLSHTTGHPDDGSDPANPPIWEDFACVASVGTMGCGVEQQLESTHAALTSQSTVGMPNEGFLRDDSLLVVVYVTDEDDCSAADDEMFNLLREDLGNISTRCYLHTELLHPISRFRDALLDSRGGDADNVIVLSIAGIPTDGSWNPGDSLDDLRAMVVEDDTVEGIPIRPICETTAGAARPGVRLVELAYEFGDNGLIASICKDDWSDTMTELARLIQEKI